MLNPGSLSVEMKAMDETAMLTCTHLCSRAPTPEHRQSNPSGIFIAESPWLRWLPSAFAIRTAGICGSYLIFNLP